MSERCCGRCMNHVPTKRKPNIKKMVYNANFCFWDCAITKKPKKYDQGKECELFEDRYAPNDKTDEWVKNVYKGVEYGESV